MNRFFPLLMAIAIIALSKLDTYAQTLVYSRVLLVSAVETVPAGKVWKISNVLPNTRLTSTATATGSTVSSSSSNTTEQVIVVNGFNIFVATSNSASRWNISSSVAGYGMTSSSSNIMGSPIWLPAGATLAAGAGVQYVSVIEFTEQP